MPRRRVKLESLIAESSAAFCLLDERRRVRVFNPGMVALTGWTADDVEGLACRVEAPEGRFGTEHFVHAIYPSESVMQGHPASLQTVLPGRAGQRIPVWLMYVPLPDVDGIVRRLLIVADPDTGTHGSTARGSLSQRLHAEIASLRSAIRHEYSRERLIALSDVMNRPLQQMELAIRTDTHLTMIGAAGTGRRHFARTIHFASGAAAQSFVELDCQRLSPEILRTTLQRLRAVAADPPTAPHQQVGCLTLADADHLPADIQKILVDQILPPAGTETSGRARIRMIAVTTQPLRHARLAGEFSERLEQELSVLQIELPDLSVRGEDVLLMAQSFIESFNRSDSRAIEGMTDEVGRLLMSYRWPGNVAELRKTIEASCTNCSGNLIARAHLPVWFRTGMSAQQMGPSRMESVRPLQEVLDAAEADALKLALEATAGRIAQAAKLLGVSRPKLYRRMEALGIEAADSDD